MELAHFSAEKMPIFLEKNGVPEWCSLDFFTKPPPLPYVFLALRTHATDRFRAFSYSEKNGDRQVLLAVFLIQENSDRPTLEHRRSFGSRGTPVHTFQNDQN